MGFPGETAQNPQPSGGRQAFRPGAVADRFSNRSNGIQRGRGRVALAGTVSGMDAATEPPWTGLRRVPDRATRPRPSRQYGGAALFAVPERQATPAPLACTSAWYEERTIGPEATWLKPSS